MNKLLIYIVIFVIAYLIDLATALLHRRLRPNNFKRTEANDRFRTCLEQKGIMKGVIAYMILSMTETIILFIAVGVASWWVFKSTITLGLIFTFLLLIIVHILGTLTNLIALCKKDVLPKKPMINVNNIGYVRDNNIGENEIPNTI